ncbi:MAG: class I SAM-dependent methyltransferase [Gammaproteobacteria bacterium]
MTAPATPATAAPVDWAQLALPDTWPDRLRLQYLTHFWLIGRAMISKKKRRVELPGDMPGRAQLPRYLLQEFHYLPNGNYSKSISCGYANGFDRVMLGSMSRARACIADHLRDARCVLDIGAGAGHLGGAMRTAGIPEVWALEPSPYLLQHAARRYPGLQCVQGVIEKSGLPSGRFDGAGACFVFHEIPPRYATQALQELHRLLQPGAKLVIAEPSASHLQGSLTSLWRRFGWRGWYFRALAGRVYEPFLAAWQETNHARWLADNGFELIEDSDHMPWRLLVARRR